jgi:N-acetylmuramoyl-L-alanine amidase
VSEIEHILADVLLSSKVGESKRLAEVLQQSMVSSLSADYKGVRDLGVKRAPFYVLTGAAMPAVLVETAFISHPEEVRRLEDPTYRGRTAEALVRGLQKFVNGAAAGGRKQGG